MIQARVDWKEGVGRRGEQDGDGETGRGAMGRGRWRSGEGRVRWGRWTRRSGVGWGRQEGGNR